MKKKHIIILSVTVLALIIGAAAGFVFRSYSSAPTPMDNEHLDWVWVSETSWTGALSEQGYYYGSQALSYCDFATEKHAVLCGKAACKHDDEACDAYISTFGRNMFFGDGYLYYLQQNYNGLQLYRRDATGAALVSVGTPGEHYTKQQKSVDISHLTVADGYLFYRGKVGTDMGETVTLNLEFIARMNLSTGKEEILVEEIMESPGDHIRLCAVRKNGVIFSRYITPKTDKSDPGYLDALKQTPNALKMWSEETGEVTTLLQKSIEEFSGVRQVYGGKVFYKSLTTTETGSGSLYAYDLTTGKDEAWASGQMWHLGGGYALLRQDDGDGYDIFNLLTKEKLPNALNDLAYGGAGYIDCASKDGFILKWTGEEMRKENESDNYGYADVHRDYVAYASLADGLQQEDLIPILVNETMTSRVETQPGTTTPSETTPPTTEPEGDVNPVIYAPMTPYPDENVTKQIQYLPETVENPDNLPVLKWICLMDNQGLSVTYREDAVHDLNSMLADKNMPFRVQLTVITFQSDDGLDYSYLDWFSSPEAIEALKDADLIFAAMDPAQRQQYLMPITDYVTGDAQPSLKNAVLHENNWINSSVGDEIYGICTGIARPVSCGWLVDAEFMQQQALTPEDFSCEFWEMDELLAKLTKANGGKPVLAISDDIGVSLNRSMTQISLGLLPRNYQQIGALFAFDLAAENPTVVNLLEEETLQSIRSAVMRYKAAGYVATAGSKAGAAAKITYATIPGSSVFTDSGTVRIPGGPTTQSISYASPQIVGIAAVSRHKDEALSLLHLIAEDEAFRNQLCHGTEGQDYTITDGKLTTINDVTVVEHVQTYPNGGVSVYKEEKVVLYRMGFLSPRSGFGMLTEEMQHGYPCYTGKTKLETYREMADSADYTMYPIVFDFSELSDALEAMGYALGKHFEDEYMHDFYTMPEEEYSQMLQDVKAAGSDKIVAELQRQLDAFLAENPDWNP